MLIKYLLSSSENLSKMAWFHFLIIIEVFKQSYSCFSLINTSIWLELINTVFGLEVLQENFKIKIKTNFSDWKSYLNFYELCKTFFKGPLDLGSKLCLFKLITYCLKQKKKKGLQIWKPLLDANAFNITDICFLLFVAYEMAICLTRCFRLAWGTASCVTSLTAITVQGHLAWIHILKSKCDKIHKATYWLIEFL